MALVVVRPGAYTTIQDRGRPGHRRFGVPVGGAADRGALDLANALLGNSGDAAALELTLLGGTFHAEVDLALALTGATMAAIVEPAAGPSRPWPIPQTGTLRAGETLVVGGATAGARSYLAVRGGWQAPIVLGSRSTERPLCAGDRLDAAPSSTSTRRPAPKVVAAFGPSPGPIRWVDGPDAGSCHRWFAGAYRVLGESNRVGVRLDGAVLDVAADPSRPSRPVAPGAIQVAGGRPIILGVAGGTIGGYPHVAHVVAADLDRLAQLRPGDAVGLERITLAEARRLDAAQRQTRTPWQSRLAVWAGV